MATLIGTDGVVQPIEEELRLESMQRLLDGYLQVVTIGGTRERRDVLIVDGEGLLKGKPVNLAATRLLHGDPPCTNGVVVGDAIHCVIVDSGLETERYE